MTAKRLRAPKLKDGELRMYWGSQVATTTLMLSWHGKVMHQ